MSRETYSGTVSRLRVHREIGYGPPDDHIRVHAIVEVDGAPDGKAMGFPLDEPRDAAVHEAWLDMLREAHANDQIVEVESDFETEAGNNGIVRRLTVLGH